MKSIREYIEEYQNQSYPIKCEMITEFDIELIEMIVWIIEQRQKDKTADE